MTTTSDGLPGVTIRDDLLRLVVRDLPPEAGGPDFDLLEKWRRISYKLFENLKTAPPTVL